MHDRHAHHKQRFQSFRSALYDIEPGALKATLGALFAPDAIIHMPTPFPLMHGAENLVEHVYQPLINAIPDVERRDFIVMAGESSGQDWIGCAGHYIGVFENPWLDIPPTQQAVAMRYHEFFRMEDDRIVEMQALWDIPQVMMQAHAWPMSPSLGQEWLAPAPATSDGIVPPPYDSQQSQASVALVLAMLQGLGRSTEGVHAMELERYWHPKMNWYGPAGIGTARRLSGFRLWHQIPFLNGMPDRQNILENGALFGDGDYVGFTAFPGMAMTISHTGWLGIAPANQRITMRSLDFWRCENNLIRENWVLVDLLHVYEQIGVDVFARMRELTFARQPGSHLHRQAFHEQP
ncbi:MAG: nuclear transport factor 2 family protein [Anaerolineae bacterium]